MDRHHPLVGEGQGDDLEEVAGPVGSDEQHLWWIGVRIEVCDDDCVATGVQHVSVADTMLAGRAVNLHTELS